MVVSVFLRRSNRRFCSTQTSITRNKCSLIGGRFHATIFVKGGSLQRQSVIWVRVKSLEIKTLGLVIKQRLDGRARVAVFYFRYKLTNLVITNIFCHTLHPSLYRGSTVLNLFIYFSKSGWPWLLQPHPLRGPWTG